ncbi:MAG TPA: sugar ABC transporter permease [Thermomicrobiales bacterium]
MSTATGRSETPAIAWSEDADVPEGRYLLDRAGLLGPLMLLPAIIYIIGLVGIPLVLAVLYSFSNATVGDQSINWVGLENFRTVVQNATFRMALKNTILFAFVSQIIVIILANILALVLSAEFRGKRLVRFLVMLPWTTPIALAVLGWFWMLDNVASPIDALMRMLHIIGPDTIFDPKARAPILDIPFGDRNVRWLSKPDLARLAVLTVHVWRTLPLATVILLAGMTAIPQDVKDAAEIDGASYWRQLIYVRLPLLAPIMAVAVLYGIVFTFTDFTVVYVLTRGGPVDSTQVLATWAYFKGIQGSSLAQGAAIALFLLPILVAAAIVMLRLARRSETA